MHEFRLVYNSPCQTDGLGKTGYVCRRIHVRVPPVSARTREAMLNSFSDSPASRAGLTCVGGFHENYTQTSAVGFVGNEVLKLTESPSMQPRSDTLTRFNVIADVGQIFKADFAGADSDGFGHNGLTGFVIDMANMPLLTPGDSLKLTSGGLATVGLEAAAMGKVTISMMSKFFAPKDLAGTGGGERVFAHVNTENTAAGSGGTIGEIEDKIEIPNALADDQPGFLWHATRKQISLMLANSKLHTDPTGQGEQREPIVGERIGAFVEINGRGTKINRRNRLVLGDTFFVGIKRFVSVCNTAYCLTYHLAAECRALLANQVVGQMV